MIACCCWHTEVTVLYQPINSVQCVQLHPLGTIYRAVLGLNSRTLFSITNFPHVGTAIIARLQNCLHIVFLLG